VVEHLELSVLYHKFTSRCLTEVRFNLEDGFKSYFDKKLKRLSDEYGTESKFVVDAKELEESIRQRLTSIAVDAVCSYSDKSMLDLVRRTIDGDGARFSEVALGYLGRFGDWSDIDRILSFVAFFKKPGSSLIAMAVDEVSQKGAMLVASALYAVSKGRLIDLLYLKINPVVRRCLMCTVAQRDIGNLEDEILIRELNHEDELVRKATALRIAQSCTTRRVKAILSKYMLAEKYYYNAAHWLDLGASIPQEYVRRVTTFELARLSR
jgi:hypothetical protein